MVMFEKILSISKNNAIVKISNNISDDILNYNVVLEDNNKKILGEIDEVVITTGYYEQILVDYCNELNCFLDKLHFSNDFISHNDEHL